MKTLHYGVYIDHEGTKYTTLEEMCSQWGIDIDTYVVRVERGYSLEETLTKPPVVTGEVGCKDHTGKKFKSITEMCKHWNVSLQVLRYRVLKGMTLEKALTLKVHKSVLRDKGVYCTDHLGNEFGSTKEMCKHYGIKYETFRNRIKLGWSLEDALNPALKAGAVCCTDHLGNDYKSVKEMCEKWGISTGAYIYRTDVADWSVEEALTTPTYEGFKVKDHNGVVYSSLRDMCSHYGIGLSTFKSRLNMGWSLEKALTTPLMQLNVECKDHLGNTYESVSEMCRHYGVELSTYRYRIEKGFSVEQALCNKLIRKRPKYADHLGNTFSTINEMCCFWGVAYSTYLYRIDNGWSVEDALTKESNQGSSKKCKDHLGNEYNTLSAMCKHYNITLSTYMKRLYRGYSVEEALTSDRSELKFASSKKSEVKVPKPLPKDADFSGVKRLCQDHLGNNFASVSEMCAYHGVTQAAFLYRIKKGYPLEEALSVNRAKPKVRKPMKPRHIKQRKCIDHLGNVYKNVLEMCKAWDITLEEFEQRLRDGYTVGEALTDNGRKFK